MASTLPIVRQIAWLSLVPQLILMMALMLAARAAGLDHPPAVGAVAYLALSFALRQTISKHHRAGMKLFKQERFAEAIPEFRRSYDFFQRHQWVDRWRAITMLSSNRMTFREMALVNTAFCLALSGQREQAIAEYKKAIAEFPDSKLAQTSLKMMTGPSD